mmetsp:Transcript_34167/g.93981  ORF Transcript_34167/g.93981 Transcript_34167/m.93981 type:complete len:329 (+) Transcript_34167:149-1135(+)
MHGCSPLPSCSHSCLQIIASGPIHWRQRRAPLGARGIASPGRLPMVATHGAPRLPWRAPREPVGAGPPATPCARACPQLRRAAPQRGRRACSVLVGGWAGRPVSVVARLERDGGVLVGAALEPLGRAGLVDDLDLALEDDLLVEGHLALDRQLGAVDQRRRAVLHQAHHVVHKLVAPVELDVGRHAVALRLEDHPEVVCDLVRVRHEREHVRRRLDGREARARDEDRLGSLEALDGRAHGRLELKHLGRLLVTRVDRLAVADHRQRHRAAKLLECRLERLEVDPQVVGVEVLVLRDVLEGVGVLVGALRQLAQQQPACARFGREGVPS